MIYDCIESAKWIYQTMGLRQKMVLEMLAEPTNPPFGTTSRSRLNPRLFWDVFPLPWELHAMGPVIDRTVGNLLVMS